MAQKKTLAMKFLDGKKVSYRTYSYPSSIREAEEVASSLGLPPDRVFKTLVVSRKGPGKHILVMIPANQQLNLKKLAKIAGEKKLKMATHHDAETLTGLRVGGISALALTNHGFEVFLDESAQDLSEIVVSAGERGRQIELSVADLVEVTRARFADVFG